MGRPSNAIWTQFHQYTGPDEEHLKKMHNKSHKNAWCKYCIEAEIDQADNTPTSLNRLGSDNRERHRHNAMRIK